MKILGRVCAALTVVVVAAFLLSPPALAQGTVLMSGPLPAGHVPMGINSGGNSQTTLFDSGPAGGAAIGYGLSEELLQARTPPGGGTGPFGAHRCDWDTYESNPQGAHYLCVDANLGGGAAALAIGSIGPATPSTCNIILNGQQFPCIGQTSGIPFVATESVLTATPTTFSAAVVRLDYSVGMGAPPLLYRASASPCTLNAGAGDGGSQVRSSDGHCWIAQFPADGAPVTEWGADPTGVANSQPAMLAGATYAAANAVPLIIPAGNFTVGSAINVTMPSATAGLTVIGNSAISSILTWGASGGGWNVTGTTSHNAYHFRDLGLRCSITNCGTALALTNNGTSTFALNEPSDITNVSIEGTDVAAGSGNTDYWATGVQVQGVSLVNFNNYYWVGSASPYNGVGVNLGATGVVPFGVAYNFVNSNLVLGQYGIVYNTNAQGVALSNTNITGATEGIFSNCAAGCVELQIATSQFSSGQNDIDIEGQLSDINITSSLFFANAGFSAIKVNSPTGPANGAEDILILSNQFEPTSGASEGNGININSNSTGAGGAIFSNSFLNVPTDITLGANAHGWTIGVNEWGGGTPLVDNATGTNYQTSNHYIFGQAQVNFAANGLTQWVGTSVASAGGLEGTAVQVFPTPGKIFAFLGGVAPALATGQSITFTLRLPTTVGNVVSCTLSGPTPTLCPAGFEEAVAGGIPFDVQVTASSTSIPLTTIDWSIFYSPEP